MTVDTEPFYVLEEALNFLKTHDSLMDLKIKYLDENDNLIERKFCKALLIMKSKYFLDSLVNFPEANQVKTEVDLTICPFKGIVLETLFEFFFLQKAKDHDFEKMIEDGILVKVYEAAKYFGLESLISDFTTYFNEDIFDHLLDTNESPEAVFNIISAIEFYSVLFDSNLVSVKEQICNYISLNLTCDLEKCISSIPAKILGEVMDTGFMSEEETAAHELLLDAFDKMNESDKEILKPYMLRNLNFVSMDMNCIKNLASTVSDYEMILTRVKDYYPMILNNLTSTNTYVNRRKVCESFIFTKNLSVKVPIKYQGHQMELVLYSQSVGSDIDHLCCFLYRDCREMKRFIPEYSVSILEISSCKLLKNYDYQKCHTYVSNAKEQIAREEKRAGWGSREFISKSKLVENAEYLLVLDMKGLATLDQE